MCIIFGGANVPLAEVKGTKIFIAPLSNGKQLTIYENQVSLHSATPVEGSAMILPVPAGMIQLLDLSASCSAEFPQVFGCLKRTFPTVRARFPANKLKLLRSLPPRASMKLAVKEIGNYFVSVAPCLEDIALIDPLRFQVPQGIQQVLSTKYGDGNWSFVICRFKSAEVRPHPIGYVHERSQDGRLFVPTRHAHGSESDHKSIPSWLMGQLRPDQHDDWDHELYFWGCEDVMQLTDNHHSDIEAGETPGEMAERLWRKLRELPTDVYTFYDLTEGIQVQQSTSLLNNILTKNKSAHLSMSAQQACEPPGALRYREIKPSSPSNEEFPFQSARFGGPGLDMPNADLMLTVNQVHLASLPDPITKKDRAIATMAMQHEWIHGRCRASQWPAQNDMRLHKSAHPHNMFDTALPNLSLNSTVQAILRLSMCKRRKHMHASVDSLV